MSNAKTRCAQCRRLFPCVRSTARFCSTKCRVAHHRAKYELIAKNNWHTPAAVIALARDVLGTIDLDPASCAEANAVVQAETFYAPPQDGLKMPWRGRTWCNPPYGRGIERWVVKLVHEVDASNIAGLALVPARVDTRWFARLHRFPVCFLNGRLQFSNHANGAPFPSAVVCCGADIKRFAEVFGPYGAIAIFAKVSL